MKLKRLSLLFYAVSLSMLLLLATACSSSSSTEEGKTNDSDDSSAEPIKVGIIEDATGEFALIGQQKLHAYELAAKEINEAGGLLGRPIELITPDAQSDNNRYQEFARKLILEDEVAVIHAAISSAAREAIRPIMEEHKMLYFYNQQYEGGVASKYTFLTGAVPDHQVVPLMSGLMEQYGKNIYTIAADYNFGQITADWIRHEVEANGGTIIGEEFIPVGVSQFSSTISKINQANPDILVVLLAGNEQTSFFGQWQNEGIPGLPMATTVNVAQQYEHKRFEPPSLANLHVVAPFLEEYAEVSEPAKEFVEKWHEIWPDEPYIGMEAEAAYNGLHLWALAVEKAGTTEVEAVIDALETGISFDAPSGTITIDPRTHHTIKDLRMVRVKEDHTLEIVNEWKAVAPDWLHDVKGVNLVEKDDFTQYSPLD